MTKDEALKKAFKQAFQLGQDYWYQADHEFESQNKKSDVTRAKFEQLMEDAIKEALAQPDDLDVWKVRGLQAEAVIEKFMAQPEQEPVAFASHGVVNWIADKQFQHEALLYSAPQRTWVGLTDEEIDDLSRTMVKGNKSVNWLCQAIEAKLKEKNS